ncbi:IS21-like element helper ATPase IstB [bacterium AH-315-E09]|nr:IS21-like element helper ATPase IstB [bacterium AH-315-L21]MBN4074872.1 IS21-like element helper ATPase IstB [bacterium AH-315-E09]
MDMAIIEYSKQLKLGTIAKEWDSIEYVNKKQYIHDLLLHEIKEREINRINRAVKSAGFKIMKTLSDFQWSTNIDIPSTITKEEIEIGAFVNKKENLIMIGAVGTGKSHLASAIALETCRNGKKVKFFSAAELANTLLEKHQKGTLNAFMKMIKTLDLLVLDEVGFVPLHRDGAELIFQLISDCYESRSLIVTSNLEFSGWNTVFGDNRLTAAIVDRLVHHSHILVFSGESYRLKQSMQRQRQS